jgi:hypothetical protein
MPSAIASIKWENYAPSEAGPGLFAVSPLTYSSSQDRLHAIGQGSRLWLVSRCPGDQQYYFVGCLLVSALRDNPPGSRERREFGRFAVVADANASYDLRKRFPGEGLLRAFRFEPEKPIQHGASLGQSIQAIRFLSQEDDVILSRCLSKLVAGEEWTLDTPFGLWTKCDGIFADYFLKNWKAQTTPLAFLLYDSPPVLTPGAPIFIHSDKNLRLVATFRESQFVAGHKYTVDPQERASERERIGAAYRARTIDPPTRSDFDSFWDRQNGVRSLFVMENLLAIREACPFSVYGRVLEWGYPTGVGYRYLSLSQCVLLLRCSRLPPNVAQPYLEPLLRDQ